MGLTVTSVTEELGQRVGPLVMLVNLPSVMAWAARETGFPTADPLKAVDSDLALVSDEGVNEFLDFCRYECAQRILDNLDPVVLKDVGVKEDVNVLRAFWRERVDSLSKLLREKYLYEGTTLATGVIGLEFESLGTDVDGSDW